MAPSWGFRILSQTGVGQIAHQRKSTIWAISLYSKHQKSYQGTLRTQESAPIRSETSLGPFMDPAGPLKLMVPYPIIFRVCIPFLHCILFSPSNHFGILFWSLWNSTKAQGTLLGVHGSRMDSKMDTTRLISGDPW